MYHNLLNSVVYCPGQAAQFIRAMSQYTKFAGSIPSQGTYKNQTMNE